MIEYEKRAMIEAEDKYTFRQSTQISMQTGLIGHLRADMDTDGNGFFSSWFDFREELKTDEFKAEFDEVINSLREEGDILHNRRALAKYCYCTPQSRMQEEPGYYGVRVDTEKYAYLLRLNPDRGEYNLYCYCYRRDWLDQHLKDAEKGIRFIDSHYKELFRIPDGGKVKIHYSWNEEQIRTCRYIDDYHVEIGSNLYHICEFAERMEYVTENTFDSYLYQLVESKQKFIGQIMTSKSPVRSAEDIDETALSYAEIKALCAGNPHIKEKMDLDIDVSRLKLLKANHLSQRYALEDQILKEFPQKIKSLEQRIEGYQTDIDQRKRNTEPNEDGFSPMIMPGGTVREKKAAGDAILGLCKSMTSPDPIPIGQYRGFDMELSFDTFSREYKITLIHQLRHTVTLGTDIFGNIQRLDNTLGAFEERMAACVEQLENTRVQLENAKAEVQKPFPQEEELSMKTARLNELNALLNLDKSENEIVDGERGEEELSRSSNDRER